ncbi:calsyntenin-2 isoform X1 [Stegostoma tigrinum]|uniref:calsyntenin-2 isoform X1 n=1 Tax=Stegostoma tigrinum TaxID=3053191 RepID=UPI00202AFF8D|nr:calsyntenin-2 isoform X1 [Stegostoma tigrinum]
MQLRIACAQESALILLLGWLCSVLAHRGHNLGVNNGDKRVNKHKPWIETSYHGTITENNDTVFLDPPLVALDKDAPVRYAGEICAFKIHGQDVPFEAVVLNRTSGQGLIRAKSQIDCELQKEYTFIIQAYDCGARPSGTSWKKSHKAVVHIQVNDVNEYTPTFKETIYKGVITEGKLYDNILQVEAVDEDCSPQYSQICTYEIVTPDVPYAIDRNGNIRNTEKLSYDEQHQYKFMVTAYDCGQKKAAENVLVHIEIKPVCKPGWQGWDKRKEYESGSGSKVLFPNIHLETCGEPVSSVQTRIDLQTSHIGKGCDRDTYSEKSLQKLCGASSESVNLLPAPYGLSNWTSSLLLDSGHDSDLIFRFDGKHAAKIPDGVIPKNLSDQFTITMWMKHGPSPGLRAEKETILCNSDKTEMNRHHYALYVHNCRLVFLLRRDFDQVDTFRPAEFHWKLEQICDKEWHYYVINVEFPVVTLYVDGVTYNPYLVTDDWPIHPSHIDMQLTVGACWQGGEIVKPRFAQFFHGSLAGLSIRPGKIESRKVISCLQTCKEGLDINSLESLGKEIKFHFNPAQSVLVIEGDDIDTVNQAMQLVAYINSRQFPTPGIRRYTISTTVQCFGEDTCISISDVSAYIVVLQPVEPKITISGLDHFSRPASEFENNRGVILFPGLRIISTIRRGQHENGKAHHIGGPEEIVHNLDYCDILIVGDELNSEEECLELEPIELHGKHLEFTNSTSGMSIYGVDTMANYEHVLRKLRYRNWETASIFGRKFRLTCSELNGRYTSNEFNLEVNVLHNINLMDHVNHVMAQPQFLQSIHHPLPDLPGHNLNAAHSSVFKTYFSVIPSAATIVIVVCISFLVFIIVLGVFRIRAAHQRTNRESESGKENEMDWDDSALTITVNPMENYEDQQHSEQESEEEEEGEEDDITSADSEESEEEEEAEHEEDQQDVTRQEQLEWDDSTLHY